ncbi:glycosyl hydrolase [Solwaraspora sp. WMMD1047]|uniref:glycoside hydrolase family 26 protein n=1 Tax=Solwaraspora sp. WMMD1047 TaxID=3016102 RepID=UPI002417BADB|nr:glycosyl hydrolase [Solwaraspora sp. WMMD1047]MDG4829539.1 glycosyl hydrolase [Solwaraspora sp. WMMD1047]
MATVDDVLGGGGRVFGVTLHDRSEAAVTAVAEQISCRPSVMQVFASVERGISVETLSTVPATPMLSIEPWRSGGGSAQPDWSLSATIDGRWDREYDALARTVVGYRQPILIRFGHEMNGHWYPWGTRNGNSKGEYVRAWRHVVDRFRQAGATNALWVWSPNIIRGADSRTIKEFWPGEQYVDIVGVTGYGVREKSPEVTYRPTLRLVYALTDKPILLTEVGVQPGADKKSWLKGFGPWLEDNPRVAGFVWYQVIRQGDWRYDDTPANLAAFKSGLSSVELKC